MVTTPTRRAFLTGVAAVLITAPAIVRVASLDRVRGVVVGADAAWLGVDFVETGRWSSRAGFFTLEDYAAQYLRPAMVQLAKEVNIDLDYQRQESRLLSLLTQEDNS